MPRKQQRLRRPQHLPQCKYYQGQPPANTAIFDVQSRQDEVEEAARRANQRLQLQRLPALTIRRQLQVQWGPTVSLPQPGESPPPGQAPGQNVRLVEVRRPDTRAARGQTSAVQKPAEPQQPPPPALPLKRVDVSPLRELPPEQPQPQASPRSPLAVPPTPWRSSSPRRRTSPDKKKSSPSGRRGRHAASEVTRGRPPAVTLSSVRHAPPRVSRGSAKSGASVNPGQSRKSVASLPSRRTAASPSTHRSTTSPSVRRSATHHGTSPRRDSPAVTTAASAPRSTDRPPSPRRAPTRVDIAVTSLPPTVQGGITDSIPPDALFRELSAAAEARLIDTVSGADLTVADDPADGVFEEDLEVVPFRQTSIDGRHGLAPRDEADADDDEDLWSTAEHIRRQQEAADIEHRVLDLIGARVVAGLLNMDRKLDMEKWGEHHMQQPPLPNEMNEVGEHGVLGEGISLEETEIRTPVNYDDYLDQEPADDGDGCSDNADGGSLNYEDDFEDDEEEANYQETPPVIGDTREELKDRKSTSVPDIKVVGESLQVEKFRQGSPEVIAAGPGLPAPAASSHPRGRRHRRVAGVAPQPGSPRRRRVPSASPYGAGTLAARPGSRQPRR